MPLFPRPQGGRGLDQLKAIPSCNIFVFNLLTKRCQPSLLFWEKWNGYARRRCIDSAYSAKAIAIRINA